MNYWINGKEFQKGDLQWKRKKHPEEHEDPEKNYLEGI